MTPPKFILSKKIALRQFNLVQSLCDIVSYSSKTNPLITPILEEKTSCMFSVHLKNELKNIKDLSRVLFLAQGWTKLEIKSLINSGITSFVVDNESDLNTLIEFLKASEKIQLNHLMLRIKLKENTLKTERYFVFGMKSGIVNKKIKEIREDKILSDRIKNLGIHFHRKSQNMAEWNLKYEFIDMIDKNILNLIDIVNIGGGLPSEYANTNVNVIRGIFKKLKEFKTFLNKNKIKMIIEPGRFIAAPAGKLVTKIIGVYENNIIVNASVYNSDMDALIVPVKLLVQGELEKGSGIAYAVKGITPCSMDLFRYRVYLASPQVGDELIFLNAGAYNFSTDFCDLEKITTEVVE